MVATTANDMAKIVDQLCDERDRLRAELAEALASVRAALDARDEQLRMVATDNAAKEARIAELEACLRKAYGRLAGTEVYPSRLVREEIVEVLKEANP